MLTFNLKKEWFEKIKSGEKTHEYRQITPYWEKRIEKKYHLFWHPNYAYFVRLENRQVIDEYLDIPCEFVCGYAKKNDKDKRLKAKIKTIYHNNGLYSDLKIDKLVYDIEFELITEV